MRYRNSAKSPIDSVDVTDPPTIPPSQPSPTDQSLLGRLDEFMAANPLHPRVTPFFVYIVGLFIGSFITGPLPIIIPLLYTFQVGLVVFLLVRYRKLLPEMTLTFHWLAVPTGLGLLAAWIWLGYATNWLSGQAQGVPVFGDVMNFFVNLTPSGSGEQGAEKNSIVAGGEAYGAAWYWSTLILRLLGMALVVPLFEELFVRSAVLRATRSSKMTFRGILQVISDLSGIGDKVADSKYGKKANSLPPQFTAQFVSTPVGFITLFSVVASTVVFMASHTPRDYAGCVACGVVWCLMLWYVNRPKKGETWRDQPEGGRAGLGPISWSHGITNAGLWVWTIWYSGGDWQFL